MSDKNGRPVKLTSEALRAHDNMKKPQSRIQSFVSSADDNIAARDGSNHYGLRKEREMKLSLTALNRGDEKAVSSSRSQKKDGGEKKEKKGK